MRVIVLLALCGCPWVDDATRAALVDRDGDGVTDAAFGGDDCDASDASIGAPDPVSAYSDGDGDGYASDGAIATSGCPGTGGVPARGDCDDADVRVHPGAPENCLAAIDSNCDGAVGGVVCSADGLTSVVMGIDDGLPIVGSEFPYALSVLDVDGDGLPEVVASAPYDVFLVAGFSAETLRVPGDHFLDEAVFRFQAVHSQLGAALASADVVGDATPDLLVGCPSSEIGAAAGEGAYVLAIELPAAGRETEADAVLYGVQGDGFFGQSVVRVGEVDGAESVVVGAIYEGGGGAAWLSAGPWPERAATPVDALESVRLSVPDNDDGSGARFGIAATTLRTEAGPLLALGGHEAYSGVLVGGAVALWVPGYDETDVRLSPESGVGRYGAVGGEFFGYAMVSWDDDGDGLDSLVVGAPLAFGQDFNVGAVYVYHQPDTLLGWKAHDADLVFLGDDYNDSLDDSPFFGGAVVNAGDMNGDGLADLAMGAPNAHGVTHEPQAGAVYIAPGGIADAEWDVEEVTWARYGDRGGLHVGELLAGGSDLDGDGRADLVVGMPGWTAPDGGGEIGAFAIWWGDLL